MALNTQNPISIPEPTNEVNALWSTVKALKEAVETMQGIRGIRELALKDDLLDQSNDLQEQIKKINITGGANELSDLTDVNTSGPTNRNVLVADGVDWESRALIELDISNLGAYLTDAPSDGSTYGRKDAVWEVTAGGGPSLAADEAITGDWTIDDPQSTAQPLGYNTMPIYEIDANDIFDTAHQGMLWHKDAGGALSFTCDNVSAIDQGATWIVHNDDTENLTIAEGSGVTILFITAGAAPVSGSVIVEQGGIVTVYKYTNTEYWCWGSKDVTGGGASELSDLTDVTSAAITNRFALLADGANYVGRAILEADISDLQSYSLTSHIHSGLYGDLSANENITGNWIIEDPQSAAQPLGYNTMPIYEIDANDVFDIAHQGMIWHKDSGGAVTFTCDNVSAIDQGATWIAHNDDAENLTIAEGTGVTIRFLTAGGAPVTGDVIVAQGGIVTVYKYTNTEYWCWGSIIVNAEINNLSVAVIWANVPDANVTQGSVTQHEAALAILESQITDGSVLARLAANETITGIWALDAAVNGSGFGTGGKVKDGDDNLQPIGFNVMNYNALTAAFTLTLASNGQRYNRTVTTTFDITCPNLSTLPIGATWVITNEAASGTFRIKGASGVLLRLYTDAGISDVTAGNGFIFTQGATISINKVTNTRYDIWGQGVTIA